LKSSALKFFPGSQEYEDNAKKEIYENITRNFDIFEFLDNENGVQPSVIDRKNLGNTPATYGLPPEIDDMSDDLEFHI
jgi:hypothetical protein